MFPLVLLIGAGVAIWALTKDKGSKGAPAPVGTPLPNNQVRLPDGSIAVVRPDGIFPVGR